ncbi:MAG: radical SAM protein, partial [Planctomycetota bacterium]
RPVLNAIVTELGQLYELAKDLGYEDLSEGYVSACHLCLDLRKHLAHQTDEFPELQPRQLYSHI